MLAGMEPVGWPDTKVFNWQWSIMEGFIDSSYTFNPVTQIMALKALKIASPIKESQPTLRLRYFQKGSGIFARIMEKCF